MKTMQLYGAENLPWIEWSGGECPLPKDSGSVLYENRAGELYATTDIDELNWSHAKNESDDNESAGDIMRYIDLKPMRKTVSSSVPDREWRRFELANMFPPGWNGHIQIQGNVSEDKETVTDKNFIVSAESVGREPEFWSVYAQLTDGTLAHIKDFESEKQARQFAQRLRSLHSDPGKETKAMTDPRDERIAELETQIAKLQKELQTGDLQFSPGPWESCRETDYWRVYDAKLRILCEIEYGPDNNHQNAANFRLFALSERMYRFISDIYPYLDDYLTSDDGISDAMKEATKILALAEGEKP
ncbi:MAG: hypothetical protein LBI48_09700 [Burkholderiaceae bacterium]|jgi:hypothetical protein|nr:hypothetical protein [Burkholderiaceae bacterium]